jgi:RNA polymerase I-specific transcription initiation factor RRN3
MVRLCPKAKTELYPIISANAPFRTRSKEELCWYYRQCLYVLEYIPGMEGQVIDMLVDKCLEMDVEIKIVDNGEAMIDDDDNAFSDVEDMFQMDLDEDKKQKKQQTKLQTDGVSVDEMADKLDELILLCFEHVEARVRQTPSAAYGLYQFITRAFESSILITHKSKFVQFIVMNLCGLASEKQVVINSIENEVEEMEPLVLYRDFCAKLIEVILDPYRATVTRQSAACYLASFVSRASYICPETICESVAALLRWAEAYVASWPVSSSALYETDSPCSLHSLFFTVCQSAFYIMCFRGTEAVAFYTEKAVAASGEDSYDEPERIDIGEERWTKLCSHPLAPLRWCLESVRTEFLVVSKVYSLINVGVLGQLVADDRRLANAGLQRTQRKRRVSKIIIPPGALEKERQTGGVGGLGRGTNPLDSFFPFDPYLLRRSNQFVEPHYKHWKGSLSEDVHVEETDDIDQDTECSPTDLDDAGFGKESDSGEDGEDDDDTGHQSELVPTSLASHVSSVLSTSSLVAPTDIVSKGKDIHEQWVTTLKRSRAPSIENGSW